MTQETVKFELRSKIERGDSIRIELGCGRTKGQGFIGIDNKDLPGVDIIADLEEGLPFFPDDSVDLIYSSHFLEHVDNFENLMGECFRVLKKDGVMEIAVPHFSNPYFYSDYTHRRFFGLYTFHYFAEQENQLERKVPNFYTSARFRVLSQQLVFSSPFSSRKRWKRRLGALFNKSSYWQEFYEENLCYIFPCSEIRVTLAPEK